LIFLTEASIGAARDPDRGLHRELSLLRRWEVSPERPSDSRVVLVDCIGIRNEQLAEIPVLRPWSSTFRLDGRHAATAKAHKKDAAVDCLVEELIQRRLDGSIRMFPRAGVPPPSRYYQPSWAGSGGSSSVRAEPGYSKWDGEERDRILMGKGSASSELRLPIHHLSGPDNWWSALIGFRLGRDHRWLCADLSGHRYVTIAAKLDRVVPGGVPLGVRFEDDSTDSGSRSGHQSTGWLLPYPILREYFVSHELDLNSGGFGTEAFPGNTRSMPRDNVLHLALGSVPGGPSYEVEICIKSVVFSPQTRRYPDAGA
jgi:hypothetical protein